MRFIEFAAGESMKNIVMAAMLAQLLTGTVGAATAGDPKVLPPGGAAVLMWTPEQQVWGYKDMERIGPVHVIQYLEAIRAAARRL
jgi:hypothetical protein